MNSRPEAQSRQLSQNSNLACSNSTQGQETANNAEVLPYAAGDHFFMRLAAGSATPRTGPWVRATRPRSLQAPHTWWTRWYRPLSSSSSTKSSVLPISSSSSWERPSCKRSRTSEGSHQPHHQLFLPQLVQVEDAQQEKVPHHTNVPRSSTPKSQIAQTVVLSSSN